MFFGKTGYPEMSLSYWMDIFSLYKKHGFNAVRFHSSCPPEAAFEAADRLGLYLQVEFFWMDGWMGYPDLIGENNDALNTYVVREMRHALQCYGNHPSMMLVAFGNELGGDFDWMGERIKTFKQEFPNQFFAAGIAHNVTVHDDFVEYGGKQKIWNYVGTDWDYSDSYSVANALRDMGKEKWVVLPITREHCLDQFVEVSIKCTGGPNVMIGRIVLSKNS